jgi:aspartate aminotransferase
MTLRWKKEIDLTHGEKAAALAAICAGIAYTEAELAALAEVLRKYKDVMVMSDDIYNRLIFSGRSALVMRPGQISLAAHILHVAPDLQDRVIVINGVSKTCSMTGWRVGWALGPKSFIQTLADFLSQSTSNVCSIAQKAAIGAIAATDSRIVEVQRMLEQRRDLFSSGLSSVKGLTLHEPDGAFYLWVGIKDWFGKQHPRFAKPLTDSKDISEALLENAGLAVVPGLEFGTDGYLRLSLAASEKNLAQASDRMRSFANELK